MVKADGVVEREKRLFFRLNNDENNKAIKRGNFVHLSKQFRRQLPIE